MFRSNYRPEVMMAGSTLDPDNFPVGGQRRKKVGLGHDTKSLGPSDSSDSGFDMAGPGTTEGDRLGLDRGTNQDIEDGKRNVADVNADRVVGADEAGLGEGLDQAEEARLGETDEQRQRKRR
jgi:hypothetical protein